MNIINMLKRLFRVKSDEQQIREAIKEAIKQITPPPQRISLGKEDVVIFTFPRQLSESAYVRLKKSLEDVLNRTNSETENKVLILEEGLLLWTVIKKTPSKSHEIKTKAQ